MSHTDLNVAGLASERDVLIETYTRLGHYRQAGDQAEFERTLQALGMTEAEAGGYWGALSQPRVNSSESLAWKKARNNTEMAQAFGILLNSRYFPRNWLLYRLMECHLPDILRVGVVGHEHLGGVKSRCNPPHPP